jgi:hypothetical protein
MKINYLIRGPMLWAMLLLRFAAAAQGVESGEPPGKIAIGAKIGVSLNQFSQPGTVIGPSVGAFASYEVLPFLKVKVEPQYSQQGGARQSYYIDYSSIDGDVSSITHINPSVIFHNLEVPLLLELTLNEYHDEAIIPKLILGGSYSLMMSASETSTLRYNFNDGTPSIDVAYRQQGVIDNYTHNQYSAIGGFGIQFRTGKHSFQFDIRYRQGFTQLNRILYPDAFNLTSSSSLSSSSSTSSAPSLPVNGVGGKLYSSSLSFNFSMTIFNF